MKMRAPLVALFCFCSCRLESTQVGSTRAMCRSLENALKVYKLKHERLPDRESGLSVLFRDDGAQMTSLTDSWGRTYAYDPDATPHVRSAGPDGVVGTADDVTRETAASHAGCASL